jgi:hypothetical protein
MDSDDEDVMAALMDEELVVAAATRGTEEDKSTISGSAPGHLKIKPRRGWKATACSTPTTSPTIHCTTIPYSAVVSG